MITCVRFDLAIKTDPKSKLRRRKFEDNCYRLKPNLKYLGFQII
jgi:hypothetical protein